jgi:hypothetical protein
LIISEHQSCCDVTRRNFPFPVFQLSVNSMILLTVCLLCVFDRDDGSGIVLKALKRVQRGLDQGSISSLQPHKVEVLDYWDGGG